MKSYTNYTPGMRGINTADGTVWIEPGQTIELDPKTIVGALPDLGKKGSAPVDNGDLEALNAKVTELTKQVEDLTTENKALEKDKTELTKQVEDLTKPPAK